VIRRIPGVRGAQAYLHQHREGLAVIDPGYTGSFRAVLRFVEAEALGRIDWVILTHHHIDHAGTALALCQATGARLAVHEADAPYLQPRRPKDRMTLWGLADRLPSGLARFVVTCAGSVSHLLKDGETIAGLTVVHGPGHTPGSIGLHSESESALFLGDILNNERGIRTPPWNVNHSHRLAMQAPQRLGALSYERAYFGHGPTILGGADQVVRTFLARRSAAGALTA
jgi:glyoxylase-like metal-dependent hydrolase (beta-lactamase superfamily II)